MVLNRPRSSLMIRNGEREVLNLGNRLNLEGLATVDAECVPQLNLPQISDVLPDASASVPLLIFQQHFELSEQV